MINQEEAVEREFLQTALKRSELLRLNDAKKANKEYDKAHMAKGKLRQLPDRGEAALKRIVAGTEDLDVQILAAAALLALDEGFATDLLERIQNSGAGIPSFTAEMTLREW